MSVGGPTTPVAVSVTEAPSDGWVCSWCKAKWRGFCAECRARELRWLEAQDKGRPLSRNAGWGR